MMYKLIQALLIFYFVSLCFGEGIQDECAPKKEKRNATYWIEALDLEQSPPGSYTKNAYTSPFTTLSPEPFNPGDATRAYGMTDVIIFKHDTNILFHKLPVTSVTTWIQGSTLRLDYFEDGKLKTEHIGVARKKFVLVTKAGLWARMSLQNPKPGNYVIVSVSIYPAITNNDVIFAKRDEMLAEYPQYEDIITKHTIN